MKDVHLRLPVGTARFLLLRHRVGGPAETQSRQSADIGPALHTVWGQALTSKEDNVVLE